MDRVVRGIVFDGSRLLVEADLWSRAEIDEVLMRMFSVGHVREWHFVDTPDGFTIGFGKRDNPGVVRGMLGLFLPPR